MIVVMYGCGEGNGTPLQDSRLENSQKEEPGRLQSMGSLRVGHYCPTSLSTFHFHALEKAMATHSSTLAWKIPWTEEPGGLQSMGSLRVGHDYPTSLSTFHFHALEKKMATHSSVLAWRIPGMGELGRWPSMGSDRVGHD